MRRGEPLGFRWSYIDLMWAALVCFMALSVYSLMAAAVKREVSVKPQGDLIFTLHWDPASDSDIDLWVLAPGDQPVGYSHPTDVHCNLVRDDLGHGGDSQSRNEEMTLCRGTPAGEYVVDVMAYNVRDGKFPVGMTVSASRVTPSGVEQVFSKKVELGHNGEQFTVTRFKIDKDGNVLEGSFNDLPMPLYGVTR